MSSVNPSDVAIFLYSKSEMIRKLFAESQALIERYGFQLNTFESVDDFRSGTAGRQIICVISDLKTLLTLKPEEREYFLNLEASFPVLRVSYNAELKELGVLAFGETIQGKEFFELLLNTLKNRGRPREVRRYRRHMRIYNIEYAVIAGGSERWVRGNTLNLSQGGTFILTADEFRSDQKIKIRFCDDPASPMEILCSAKWILPWGKSRSHFAGVGLQFEGLDLAQKQWILEQLGEEVEVRLG